MAWARHLLARIEGPMAQLKAVPGLLASEEGQRVVREYNKLATVLVRPYPLTGAHSRANACEFTFVYY